MNISEELDRLITKSQADKYNLDREVVAIEGKIQLAEKEHLEEIKACELNMNNAIHHYQVVKIQHEEQKKNLENDKNQIAYKCHKNNAVLKVLQEIREKIKL